MCAKPKLITRNLIRERFNVVTNLKSELPATVKFESWITANLKCKGSLVTG